MLAWLTVALAAVPDTVEKKSGLPQLNAPDMVPQLIWLALTFGILYFVLSRVTLPRIASVIEERSNRIQRDLDDAERFKGETDEALAAYEQALAEAMVGPTGLSGICVRSSLVRPTQNGKRSKANLPGSSPMPRHGLQK